MTDLCPQQPIALHKRIDRGKVSTIFTLVEFLASIETSENRSYPIALSKYFTVH